jgi:hypothetical protein
MSSGLPERIVLAGDLALVQRAPALPSDLPGLQQVTLLGRGLHPREILRLGMAGAPSSGNLDCHFCDRSQTDLGGEKCLGKRISNTS